MFESEGLESYLSESQSINSRSLITAEWNMNDPEKIEKIGNYFHPIVGTGFDPITDIYDPSDQGGLYTGGTDADVEVYGGFDEFGDPTVFLTKKVKTKLLYSLDDCFRPHRPRSGINYARFLPGSFIDGTNLSVNRPRYYMGAYESNFRYWSSVRDSGGDLAGISKSLQNDRHLIDDVAPFVVYSEEVPANKIVVKMQTNVGTEDRGEIRTSNGLIPDPLYGEENATTPTEWRVQILGRDKLTWQTVKTFNSFDRRTDGSPIVGPDGYVELNYGIVVPEEYTGARFLGTLVSANNLPESVPEGGYYLIVPEEGDLGEVYISVGGNWQVFFPEYGWYLREDYSTQGPLVTGTSSPDSYNLVGTEVFREFEHIHGIRIIVDSMNKEGCSFDLIEISPRLCVDISDKTSSYDISKSAGKIDVSKLPLGSLEPGTGSIKIFDDDGSFLEGDPNSIISGNLQSNVSISFFEVIRDYNNTDYFVPIKKMYTENKAPQRTGYAETEYELRDLFYLFENTDAPPIMLTGVSLSGAVSVLLDWCGFSNYTFKYSEDEVEPIIPFFFVKPDQNVAQVLQSLAVATQSAMFFDENNNFVVMGKEYMMPASDDVRPVDKVLDGDSSTSNIIEISSNTKESINKGTLSYTERYIQRSTGSLQQQSFLNADQSWIYTPALLWEVAGGESTRTVNDAVSTQSSYSLAAMPLASDLSDELPKVVNGVVVNNVINVGDAVYWLPRMQGYLYAGGEIIRFDAVEYSVQGVGNVWITSNSDYQKYMGQLVFNGKMYPTGLVRIFSEPNTRIVNGEKVIANNEVKSHGRGQFNTEVTSHTAGLDGHWTGTDHVKSFAMDSDYLFSGKSPLPEVEDGSIANKTLSAFASTRTGVVKNFFREVSYTDSSTQTYISPRYQMTQSSALVFEGAPTQTGFSNRDIISFVYKNFSEPYRHIGTRMRVVGRESAASDIEQSPIGSSPIYSSVVNGSTKLIAGGSGGIAIGVNSASNVGYYFEVIALSNLSLDEIASDSDLEAPHNVIFYKVMKDANGNNGVPIKLWGKQADILVDSGTFIGEGRQSGETDSTVNDLNIEYTKVGGATRFFLYLNGTQVATIDDSDALPEYTSAALFVRGKSRCMFENFYAIAANMAYDKTTGIVEEGSVSDAFGVDRVDSGNLNKNAMSGIVRNTYLKGIGSTGDPAYKIWYEEFGTIMRECAYFDIRYDRAFPALTAQISPSFNNYPGYTVSGFVAGSYGAKFLVFNATDKALNLDETSGNYLRIQGVAFTQNTSREYSMDDYYNDAGNVSGSNLDFVSPLTSYEIQDRYRDIKIKRMKNGVSEFSLSSDYIQTQDVAANLMGWIAEKSTRERKQVGIKVFPDPMIQVGDIVSLQYSVDGVDMIASPDVRFVVYNIAFTRNNNGPEQTIYLSEV